MNVKILFCLGDHVKGNHIPCQVMWVSLGLLKYKGVYFCYGLNESSNFTLCSPGYTSNKGTGK